jgi:hypothetical protein
VVQCVTFSLQILMAHKAVLLDGLSNIEAINILLVSQLVT